MNLVFVVVYYIEHNVFTSLKCEVRLFWVTPYHFHTEFIKSYKKYKLENGRTLTSVYIRGGIRCDESQLGFYRMQNQNKYFCLRICCIITSSVSKCCLKYKTSVYTSISISTSEFIIQQTRRRKHYFLNTLVCNLELLINMDCCIATCLRLLCSLRQRK